MIQSEDLPPFPISLKTLLFYFLYDIVTTYNTIVKGDHVIDSSVSRMIGSASICTVCTRVHEGRKLCQTFRSIVMTFVIHTIHRYESI